MAEQTISFRLAEPEDAPDLIAFFKAVSKETDYLVLDNLDSHTAVDSLATNLLSRQEADNQLCLLAVSEPDQTIVAVLNVTGDPNPRASHVGDIFIAVAKTYWGLGLGSALLEEACYWAETASPIKRLELTVQVRNERAVALYQKLGFTIEGKKEKAIQTSEGDYTDLYLMAKWID